MARTEILEAKNYLVNLASRSIGIAYYHDSQRAEKVAKTLGTKDASRQAEGFMLTVMSAVMPAFTRTWMMDGRIDHYFPEKRLQNLVRGAVTIGSATLDMTPFALSFLISPAFLLGKPLLNAATQAVADVIESKLNPETKLPKAPEGTYAMLEKIFLDHQTPKNNDFVIINSKDGEITVTITKEEICQIGGTCMEVAVSSRGTDGSETAPWIQGTHITRGDRVVNVFEVYRPNTEPAPPSKLAGLLHRLKIALPELT